MAQQGNASWGVSPVAAAQAAAGERADFIRRTYLHLSIAVAAFVALEAVLLNIPGIERLVAVMAGGMSWLLVLGAFMVVGWIADRWARSNASRGMQYLGLALYTVAEAVLFLPLIFIATRLDGVNGTSMVSTAGTLTLLAFGALSAVVFVGKQDFSWLRPALAVGSIIALGLIVCSIVFGFGLGTIFSGAMVVLATGAVLYSTSNVLHHYRTDQHVAASLALFASIALLFWWILRLVMAFGRD